MRCSSRWKNIRSAGLVVGLTAMGICGSSGCLSEEIRGMEDPGPETSSGLSDGPSFQSDTQCIGVPVTGQIDAGLDDASESNAPAQSVACSPGACPNDPLPGWVAQDRQPWSCGVGEEYGLQRFHGTYLVVALWAGWCPFCRAQATQLESLRRELAADGYSIQFAAVNASSARDDVGELTKRTVIPIFQDKEDLGAWAQMGGVKDDFYVYSPDGRLIFHTAWGGVDTNLQSEPNYAAFGQYLRDLARPI